MLKHLKHSRADAGSTHETAAGRSVPLGDVVVTFVRMALAVASPDPSEPVAAIAQPRPAAGEQVRCRDLEPECIGDPVDEAERERDLGKSAAVGRQVDGSPSRYACTTSRPGDREAARQSRTRAYQPSVHVPWLTSDTGSARI